MRNHISLLCLAMALCVLLSGCFSLSVEIKAITIKNAAKIEAIYHESETMFQAAAESLILFGTQEDHFLFVRPVDEGHYEYANLAQVWPYDLDNISIDSSVPLSEEQCQEIQTVCAPLIEKYDLSVIISSYATVRFMADAGTGRAAELHYLTPGAKAHIGFGVRDELYINESWYAAITSD